MMMEESVIEPLLVTRGGYSGSDRVQVKAQVSAKGGLSRKRGWPRDWVGLGRGT